MKRFHNMFVYSPTTRASIVVVQPARSLVLLHRSANANTLPFDVQKNFQRGNTANTSKIPPAHSSSPSTPKRPNAHPSVMPDL